MKQGFNCKGSCYHQRVPLGIQQQVIFMRIIACCGIIFLSIHNVLLAEEPAHNKLTSHHYFTKATASHKAEWSYQGETGPTHWGKLDPSYAAAATGLAQSPIDVPKKQALKAELPELRFEYQDEQLTEYNNGHTIQHDSSTGSKLWVGKDEFSLEQFHVHTPSEHKVDGKQFPMEIHFVHKSTKGQVAVVAVFVEASEANVGQPFELPRFKGDGIVYERPFNTKWLLPTNHRYWSYLGSFTTPPCTEGIRWIVLQEPIQLPKTTIARCAAILGNNNRPIQSLHGRWTLAPDEK